MMTAPMTREPEDRPRRSSPRHGPLLAFASCLVAAVGCDKQHAGVLPIAGVPFLDTDPLPQPPPRAALASAQWVSVSTGHAIRPEPVAKRHPAMVAALVETHGGTHDVRTVVRLRRLAFGRLPPPAEAVEVDVDALAEIGFVRPGWNVWLFGVEGQCRANVTVPMVGVAEGPGEVLEVSWRLEGCLDLPWAPVGVLAEQLPRDLQLIWAQPVVEMELDPAVGWSHPLSGAIDRPTLPSGEPPDREVIYALQVIGPNPSPIAVLVSHLRYDPDDPDDPCPIEEAVAATHGFWDDRRLARFEPALDAIDVPVLLGAIVQGEAVEALVYADGPDALVAVPPTPPPPEPENAPQQMAEFEWGPPTWTRTHIAAGLWAPDQLDAMRWRAPLAACPR
jgi:hypothetical protein